MSSTSTTMSLGNPVVQNHACPLELGFSDDDIFLCKLYMILSSLGISN